MFVASAGRIVASHLFEIGRALAPAPGQAGGWGIAYCYGNRLESSRSPLPITAEAERGKLADLRTDMALLCAWGPAAPGARETRPFVRHEPELTWAFGCDGAVRNPEKLETDGRISVSPDPAERLFLHLLSRLSMDDPIGSTTGALSALEVDGTLVLAMLSCDLLIVANWASDAGAAVVRPEPVLWMGYGDMVRYVSPGPLRSLPETSWEPIASRTVMAISRVRHELP